MEIIKEYLELAGELLDERRAIKAQRKQDGLDRSWKRIKEIRHSISTLDDNQINSQLNTSDWPDDIQISVPIGKPDPRLYRMRRLLGSLPLYRIVLPQEAEFTLLEARPERGIVIIFDSRQETLPPGKIHKFALERIPQKGSSLKQLGA